MRAWAIVLWIAGTIMIVMAGIRMYFGLAFPATPVITSWMQFAYVFDPVLLYLTLGVLCFAGAALLLNTRKMDMRIRKLLSAQQPKQAQSNSLPSYFSDIPDEENKIRQQLRKQANDQTRMQKR